MKLTKLINEKTLPENYQKWNHKIVKHVEMYVVAFPNRVEMAKFQTKIDNEITDSQFWWSYIDWTI